MRELNIEPYPIKIIKRNEASGDPEPVPVKYDIKDSLVQLLFTRELQLNASALLDRDPLARRIAAAEGPTLLLEENEYFLLKKAVDAFKGYTRNDVELVRRVYEAKPVEVQKKIPEGKAVEVSDAPPIPGGSFNEP